MRTRRVLAALLLVLGIVLLPLRAVAVTIPVLIAYDEAAGRTTTTTALGRHDAVRRETERAGTVAYDDARFEYGMPSRPCLAPGEGAGCAYDYTLESIQPRGVLARGRRTTTPSTAPNGVSCPRP